MDYASTLAETLAVVMSIMMIIAYKEYRNYTNSLLTVFYRDGIFYFVCLSGEYLPFHLHSFH
jgi:hypothetical protein